MSELLNILNDVVQDRAPGTTDTVTNLTTGATFAAEIEGNLDPFLIPEVWSRDPRAKFRLHVSSQSDAAAQLLGDLVRFSLLGQTVTAKLVTRDIDPASTQAKFLAIHLINGKDTP